MAVRHAPILSVILLSFLLLALFPVTRQDKTRQLYLTRVAQTAARLVSLGALGSIKLHIHIYNKITR